MASLDEMLRHSERHHLMLLYDDEDDRSFAEIECINKALSEGRYCVYATVNADHDDFLSSLSAKIPDYDKQIGEGNLHVVNFMPFYETAAAGDLTLFKEMKTRFEETLEARIMIGKERERLSHTHSLTLDLNDYRDGKISKGRDEQQISLLVLEPESDIRLMYRRHLHSLPIDLKIVSGGKECLQAINQENPDGYDIIIIDTHVRDSSGLHIAKKIIEENPNQQVIFTTTWDPETIALDLKAHSLEPSKYAVLHKPFMFSQLLGFIRPGELRVPR